jgi:hypothetical protein
LKIFIEEQSAAPLTHSPGQLLVGPVNAMTITNDGVGAEVLGYMEKGRQQYENVYLCI